MSKENMRFNFDVLTDILELSGIGIDAQPDFWRYLDREYSDIVYLDGIRLADERPFNNYRHFLNPNYYEKEMMDIERQAEIVNKLVFLTKIPEKYWLGEGRLSLDMRPTSKDYVNENIDDDEDNPLKIDLEWLFGDDLDEEAEDITMAAYSLKGILSVPVANYFLEKKNLGVPSGIPKLFTTYESYRTLTKDGFCRVKYVENRPGTLYKMIEHIMSHFWAYCRDYNKPGVK